MNKKILSILIQLTIWLLLLSISYNYIQKNPAEKVGFLATFDTIYTKITSIGKKFDGRKGKQLNELENYKSAFKELRWIIESKSCNTNFEWDQTMITAIDSTLKSLETSTPDQFETNKSKYITIFNRINKVVDSNCK